jgi:hypothetical protein
MKTVIISIKFKSKMTVILAMIFKVVVIHHANFKFRMTVNILHKNCN